jgi:hypothetical protein
MRLDHLKHAEVIHRGTHSVPVVGIGSGLPGAEKGSLCLVQPALPRKRLSEHHVDLGLKIGSVLLERQSPRLREKILRGAEFGLGDQTACPKDTASDGLFDVS